MLRFLACCTTLCLAVCILARPLAADDGAATKVVARWQAVQLDTLRNATALGFEGRVQKLAPALDETHDLAQMARDRVGEAWSGLTEEQRAAFVGLYRKALLADLASDMYRFREETFKQLGEQAAGEGVLVKTVEVRGDVQTSYDYRLRKQDDRWVIVDVITKDGSDQARKSETYQALIKAQGMAALRAKLEEEIRMANETPQQVISRLQDRVIEVWKQGAALGYAGRFEQLAPHITSTHDLTGMAQLTVRKAWRDWSLDQKRQFVREFRKVSIAQYASKFGKYEGQAFAFRGEQEVKSNVVIQTTLTKPGGEKKLIDYFLRSVKGKWRIVNVRIDGISELSTKQSAYGKALSRGGFQALLELVRSDIRRFASEG
jgi:phospholipid transport system substrate-binding protein